MRQNEKDNIQWLEFDLLQGFPLIHGCTMRHGGVSQGTYSSLNFGRPPCAQERLCVEENTRKLQNLFKLPKPIRSQLVHGKTIERVDGQSLSGIDHQTLVADGLSTNDPNIALLMTHADCQTAIFFDPNQKAIANVHAGWRGSVQNIYQETIVHMQREYGSNPADLLVCISPSLGPKNAEFIHYKKELPEPFWDFQIKFKFFDFWEISRWQLLACGIKPSHIEIAQIDTYAEAKDFFSHRRDPLSGRQATFCALT